MSADLQPLIDDGVLHCDEKWVHLLTHEPEGEWAWIVFVMSREQFDTVVERLHRRAVENHCDRRTFLQSVIDVDDEWEMLMSGFATREAAIGWALS